MPVGTLCAVRIELCASDCRRTIDPTRALNIARNSISAANLGDFGRRRQLTDRTFINSVPYVAGDERRPLQLSAKNVSTCSKPKTL